MLPILLVLSLPTLPFNAFFLQLEKGSGYQSETLQFLIFLKDLEFKLYLNKKIN